MRLELFKSLWGVVAADGGARALREVLPTLRAQGYAGVECSAKLAHVLNRDGEFTDLLREHDLAWVPIIFSSGPVGGWDPFLPGAPTARAADPAAAHLDALAGQVEDALALAGGARVPFFAAHSGHDSWSLPKAAQFLADCRALEAASGGAVIAHEVHRGRITYSPWNVRELLDWGEPEDMAFKLVADYSHWTAVCEAPPDDPELAAAVAGMADHVHHIHARVGYENGPQVNDPRSPEWAAHVNAFKAWWIDIWRAQRARGMAAASATPEFGPPPYQPTLPFSDGRPTAVAEEVNDWMAAELRRTFQLWSEEWAAEAQQPGKLPK